MEWTRGPTIGRGSTATVSLATATSGQLMAVKSTDLSSSLFLQREQQILCSLDNPRVVKYLGFEIKNEDDKPVYNLCLEYVSGGTLSDAILKHGGKLDECLIKLYTKQILQGLDYLHSKGIVHCDVKSQNVLLGNDGAKIADLGCAKMVEKNEKFSFLGTPLFMAPEVARGEEQGFSADVWAAGCTVIEMATGNSPWRGLDDPVSAIYRIGFSGDVPETPRWLSLKGKEFLSKCLMRDPKERWTAKELLKHPFVAEMEENLDKVNGFLTSSPNTVLGQGFWEEVDVFGSDGDLIYEGSSCCPGERVRKLAGTCSPFDSEVSNWDREGGWVTVRSDGTDERESSAYPEDSMAYEEEIRASDEVFLLFENSIEDVGSSSSLSYMRDPSNIDNKLSDEIVSSDPLIHNESHSSLHSLFFPLNPFSFSSYYILYSF